MIFTNILHQLIEVWETYLMRLDAEEEETEGQDNVPIRDPSKAAPPVQPPPGAEENTAAEPLSEPADSGFHRENE
jgi:hypothetical protein